MIPIGLCTDTKRVYGLRKKLKNGKWILVTRSRFAWLRACLGITYPGLRMEYTGKRTFHNKHWS